MRDNNEITFSPQMDFLLRSSVFIWPFVIFLTIFRWGYQLSSGYSYAYAFMTSFDWFLNNILIFLILTVEEPKRLTLLVQKAVGKMKIRSSYGTHSISTNAPSVSDLRVMLPDPSTEEWSTTSESVGETPPIDVFMTTQISLNSTVSQSEPSMKLAIASQSSMKSFSEFCVDPDFTPSHSPYTDFFEALPLTPWQQRIRDRQPDRAYLPNFLSAVINTSGERALLPGYVDTYPHVMQTLLDAKFIDGTLNIGPNREIELKQTSLGVLTSERSEKRISTKEGNLSPRMFCRKSISISPQRRSNSYRNSATGRSTLSPGEYNSKRSTSRSPCKESRESQIPPFRVSLCKLDVQEEDTETKEHPFRICIENIDEKKPEGDFGIDSTAYPLADNMPTLTVPDKSEEEESNGTKDLPPYMMIIDQTKKESPPFRVIESIDEKDQKDDFRIDAPLADNLTTLTVPDRSASSSSNRSVTPEETCVRIDTLPFNNCHRGYVVRGGYQIPQIDNIVMLLKFKGGSAFEFIKLRLLITFDRKILQSRIVRDKNIIATKANECDLLKDSTIRIMTYEEWKHFKRFSHLYEIDFLPIIYE